MTKVRINSWTNASNVSFTEAVKMVYYNNRCDITVPWSEAKIFASLFQHAWHAYYLTSILLHYYDCCSVIHSPKNSSGAKKKALRKRNLTSQRLATKSQNWKVHIC